MASERDSCARKTVLEAKKIKKRELSANRAARVTGRHYFSPAGDNSQCKKQKKTPSYL
jgi:hypothetical protein